MRGSFREHAGLFQGVCGAHLAYLDVDEDVFRLEVTVHDSVGVQLLESQKDLSRVNLHGLRREGRVLVRRKCQYVSLAAAQGSLKGDVGLFVR